MSGLTQWLRKPGEFVGLLLTHVIVTRHPMMLSGPLAVIVI